MSGGAGSAVEGAGDKARRATRHTFSIQFWACWPDARVETSKHETGVVLPRDSSAQRTACAVHGEVREAETARAKGAEEREVP